MYWFYESYCDISPVRKDDRKNHSINAHLHSSAYQPGPRQQTSLFSKMKDNLWWHLTTDLNIFYRGKQTAKYNTTLVEALVFVLFGSFHTFKQFLVIFYVVVELLWEISGLILETKLKVWWYLYSVPSVWFVHVALRSKGVEQQRRTFPLLTLTYRSLLIIVRC